MEVKTINYFDKDFVVNYSENKSKSSNNNDILFKTTNIN